MLWGRLSNTEHLSGKSCEEQVSSPKWGHKALLVAQDHGMVLFFQKVNIRVHISRGSGPFGPSYGNEIRHWRPRQILHPIAHQGL